MDSIPYSAANREYFSLETKRTRCPRSRNAIARPSSGYTSPRPPNETTRRFREWASRINRQLWRIPSAGHSTECSLQARASVELHIKWGGRPRPHWAPRPGWHAEAKGRPGRRPRSRGPPHPLCIHRKTSCEKAMAAAYREPRSCWIIALTCAFTCGSGWSW